MYRVELYGRVRRACLVDGMSSREAARLFGLHRDTVRKMLAYSVPPGYRRSGPVSRPRLDPFTGVPLSACLRANAICSSESLDFFAGRPSFTCRDRPRILTLAWREIRGEGQSMFGMKRGSAT